MEDIISFNNGYIIQNPFKETVKITTIKTTYLADHTILYITDL